jgi:hypothetical protein
MGWLTTCLGFTLLLASLACAGSRPAPDIGVDQTLLETTPVAPLDYTSEVRPILERRCVVCHGCYDAPCQLKLSSASGIERGGSKQLVYDGARITAADPTRLFIDAFTTDEWRAKGFHPVLAEPVAADGIATAGGGESSQNLERSVMYRMLRLKQVQPQPLGGRLDPSIDTSLGRRATCPTLAEFDDYASEHPKQGMPFALPNLQPDEYETLVHWLAQGAHAPPAAASTPAEAAQVAEWELFLNGSSAKEQLVARYLFEHLFQGHLFFRGSTRSFFSLVRSRTPPGGPVVPLRTRRPYGDPEGNFFYRLMAVDGSIVAKDHVTYELSPARMARLRELFLDPGYPVTELPSYQTSIAANPFRAFAALPVQSRYRFLLDDARFFIEGFIKGPVCRGQAALNVIEDRFWIYFVDPDAPLSTNTRYVDQLANYLSQPTELEDTMRLVTTYGLYLELDNRYLEERKRRFHLSEPLPLSRAMSLIWRGAGQNPSAALTVYRHLDSASVDTGLVGDDPETAWVLDYPLLERIHYLLVAGFDVYGNVGHQLNTRLFMDALRMEAEGQFLALLPAAVRRQVHAGWYTGIRRGDADELDVWWMDTEIVTGYQTAEPQHELYESLAGWLGPLARPEPQLARDYGACSEEGRGVVAAAESAMGELHLHRGKVLGFLPDVGFVRVMLDGACPTDLAYTLISDRSYKNVSSMFSEVGPDDVRDASADRLSVVPWLEGSYPDLFWVVQAGEVAQFAERFAAVSTEQDYEQLLERYAVRRTNPGFWEAADWFNAQGLREQPERGGIFDLNRYQNR